MVVKLTIEETIKIKEINKMEKRKWEDQTNQKTRRGWRD